MPKRILHTPTLWIANKNILKMYENYFIHNIITLIFKSRKFRSIKVISNNNFFVHIHTYNSESQVSTLLSCWNAWSRVIMCMPNVDLTRTCVCHKWRQLSILFIIIPRWFDEKFIRSKVSTCCVSARENKKEESKYSRTKCEKAYNGEDESQTYDLKKRKAKNRNIQIAELMKPLLTHFNLALHYHTGWVWPIAFYFFKNRNFLDFQYSWVQNKSEKIIRVTKRH